MSIKRNGKGGRLIEMLDAGNTSNNVIQLGHEAYRDGMESNNQYKETIDAVIGHTALAARMKDAGLDFDTSELLGAEIDAYNRGDMNALVANALTNYDSSGDYWKVLNNGNLMWDGNFDLYDENGQLLKESKDRTFTGSFASAMEISYEDAKKTLGSNDLNIKYDKEKKAVITLADGKNRTNDESFQFKTTGEFKARYEFQMKYVDQVMEKYGGSMMTAAQAFQYDVLMNGLYGGNMISDSMTVSKLMGENYNFAEKYDESIAKYGNVGSKENNSALFSQIAADFDAGNYTDSNKYYEYINSKIKPVVGSVTSVSTKTRYDFSEGIIKMGLAGKLHTSTVNTLAIDIATDGNNYPVVTTQNEVFFSGAAFANSKARGNYISTSSELFSNISYLHLQSNSSAYDYQKQLNILAEKSNIYRYLLPPGVQIGNVGNTGSSTREHLDMRMTRRTK